jgi:parallel beta-helix repeat protein
MTRRRRRGARAGTGLLVAMLGFVLHIVPATSSRAASACDVIVAPGDDIGAVVDAQPVRARICVSSGTYAIDETVTPKTSQTIIGLGPDRPLIDCSAVRFCFDGSLGSGVLLRRLILDGARNGDVRTGDSWVLDGVEARNAWATGIQIRGSNVLITKSHAHDNGALGISASFATDIFLVSNDVARNGTNPRSRQDRSGGIKLNGVIGLVVRGNRVHDNGGGAGIWLDTESRSFQIIGNRIFDNAGDQIRIEISCYGTVRDNTVSSGRSAAIDIFNAHDVTIASNRVNVRVGGRFGIRMFGSGRTATPGPGACLIGGSFRNANNRAVSNVVVATHPVTSNGIVHAGGIAVSNSWSHNVYDVPDCSAPRWAWWNGGIMRFLDFAAWRSVGQDRTGSCR